MNSFRALPILLVIWHFTAFPNVLSYDFNLTQPLLWETSSIPVVSNYVEVYLNIRLLNPCSDYVNMEFKIRNNTKDESRDRHFKHCTVDWKRSMKKIRDACSPGQNGTWSKNNTFQLTSFLHGSDNSSTLPPSPAQQRIARSPKIAAIYNNRQDLDVPAGTELLVRNKREPFTFALLVGSAIAIGKTMYDVDTLKTSVGQLNYQLKKMIENLNDIEKSIYSLANSIDQINNRLDSDFNWLLGDAKAQIDQNDRIYENFFKEFADGVAQHLDLPFHGLVEKLCEAAGMTVCAPATWLAKGCDVSGEDNNYLQLRMRLPQQMPEYTLVQAKPFKQYSLEGGNWCEHKYIGPQTKIVWKNGTCSEEVDYPHGKKYFEQYLPLPDDCEALTNRSDITKLWKKDHCFANGWKPYMHKFQKVNDDFVLYCPGKEILIRSELAPCPMAPFFVTKEDGVVLNGKPLPFDTTLVFNITYLANRYDSFDFTGRNFVPPPPRVPIIRFKADIPDVLPDFDFSGSSGFSWWFYLGAGICCFAIICKFFPDTFRRRLPPIILPGDYKY